MNPIRRLREQQGWTQADLARQIGCSRSLISMIETEQTTPKLSTLYKLAKVFDVPVSTLIDEPSASPQTAAAPS